MADELRIDERLAIPLAEIELRTSRSSGPGGQHANVTASRVEAVFDVEASAALDEATRERLLARAGATVTAVAQDAPRPVAQPRTGAAAAGARRSPRRWRVPRRRRPTRPSQGLADAPARTEASAWRTQAG